MKNQLDAVVNQLVEHDILFEDAVCEFEKQFIRKILENNHGNLSKAAKVLHIHRNTLSRKLATWEIDRQPKRRRQATA
ncbi:MAG TPA: helix-turn-helix domain-containing protein [Terriglobia bacterium]|nr:helix-turn-helix domain-containing protein [Terriglobia bacterium]